jgi:ribosome biogenesis GTPase A
LAIEEEKKATDVKNIEKTLIIVGESKSGKSSLINSLKGI